MAKAWFKTQNVTKGTQKFRVEKILLERNNPNKITGSAGLDAAERGPARRAVPAQPAADRLDGGHADLQLRLHQDRDQRRRLARHGPQLRLRQAAHSATHRREQLRLGREDRLQRQVSL